MSETIRHKIFVFLNHLRRLEFPLAEYNSKIGNVFLSGTRIVQVEMKFVLSDGKEEIIKFDLNDLIRIKALAESKRKVMDIEETMKQMTVKVKAMKEEIEAAEKI
jgi:hypothetical protein